MVVFTYRPEGDAKAPGIVVTQEIFGVDDHVKDVAGRCVSLRGRTSKTCWTSSERRRASSRRSSSRVLYGSIQGKPLSERQVSVYFGAA